MELTMRMRADTPVHGIYQDGHPYLEISFLKEYLDDGYVYDGTENILRYITSSHVISVSPGEQHLHGGPEQGTGGSQYHDRPGWGRYISPWIS